jgi:hypothetical protein
MWMARRAGSRLASHPNNRLVQSTITNPTVAFHFVLGLIEHAHEQRRVFRGLIGRRSGYVVQQRFREMVIRLISDELPASSGVLPNIAVARWLAGAFVELLSWWIEQSTPLKPEELARVFNELSRPALARASGV